MVNQFIDFFSEYGLRGRWLPLAANLSAFLIIIIISVLAYLVVRHVVLRVLSLYIRRNRFRWDNIMLEQKVFQRLAQLVPAIIIYSTAPIFVRYQIIIARSASIYSVIVIIMVLSALLNAVDAIYNHYDVSRHKPIKGYLQGVKIFVFVIGGVIIISNLLGESPLILLSGIGAMTAVILLIFQDSILGLVAGIQLASNDMVRIGDWIEMPQYNADGDVIEITLTTVKVQNFDRTITTIPPHALVKDSFRNWRNVMETGGRRIMRAFFIDTSSIVFCDDAMLAELKKIDCLKDYIEQRQSEIEAYNQAHGVGAEDKANGRHLTNIGTFRAYIQRYLRRHPKIHPDMIQMVRQLPPGEHGLPLELYMFTRTTVWQEFEGIQADIFDHILAVAPAFGLRIFQNPSGHDLRGMTEKTARPQ